MSSTDPAFAPIDGVDLETYARVTAVIAKSGVTTKEQAARVAAGAGVPADKWPAVSDGWLARMRDSMGVRTAFGNFYAKY
jgi:hypothetical protein